eukprot:403333888
MLSKYFSQNLLSQINPRSAIRLSSPSQQPILTYNSKRNKHSIVSICNPLLDITLEVSSQKFLDKYNLKNANAILAEELIHKQLLTDVWTNQLKQIVPGGSGLNTIRAANYMLKSKYQSQCKYFGSIGDDDQGKILQQILKDEGVVSVIYQDDKAPTGVCAAIVYNKDRSLVADLGAALKFPTSHFKNEEKHLNQAKIVYGTGFFFTSNKSSLIEIGENTSKSGQLFAFNLSATFLIDQYPEEMERILRHCDYVFGNEDEIAHFAKKHELIKDSENTIECYYDICDKIQSKFKSLKKYRHIIVTRGMKEIVYSHGQKIHDNFYVEPLPKELIKDSNGAGDSFVGGFLSQIALDKEFQSALKAGAYCSKLVLQQVGCNFPEKLPDPHQFQ